jgi:hypothetical protein
LLFVLSDSLESVCNGSTSPSLEGIQNLLVAVRNGHHLLYGSRKLLSNLSQNQVLSQRERATALELLNKLSELSGLSNQVIRKVVVTFDRTLNNVMPNQFVISASDLVSKYHDDSVLLGENHIDTEVLVKSSIHYRIHNKLHHVPVQLRCQGGGGSTIAVEFRKLIAGGSIVLAVTDGDRNHPKAPLSSVSQKCNECLDDEVGLGMHVSLSERDIENLLPLNVLTECADPSLVNTSSDLHQRLIEIKVDECNPASHICIKSGLNLRKIFECTDQEEKKFWLATVEKLRIKSSDLINDKCTEKQECAANPCKCIVGHGWGERILTSVSAWLGKQSDHKSYESFKSNDVWLNLGKVVFEVGIAANKRYV